VESATSPAASVWSADYVAESEKNEKTMTLAGASQSTTTSVKITRTRRCGLGSGSFVWSKRSRVSGPAAVESGQGFA